MELPIYYNYANVANSVIQPSTVHIRNTELHRFFARYLLQDAMSVYKWHFPIRWAQFHSYFLYGLYCCGFIGIVETDKFGVIPQVCGLSGYGICYQPTNIVVSNPLLRYTLEPFIGVNCELVRLQPDYGGIMDIVDFYADMLSLCAEAAGINLVNTHVAFVFGAANKAASDSYKDTYDRITRGEPAVVIDKNLLNEDGSANWQIFQNDVKNTYIADSLLIDMQKWINQFRTEIGLPNANTEKKERMIVDEVNANNVATGSKVSMWLEELQESCTRVNNMFGIDLGVDWRNDPTKAPDSTDSENKQVVK